MKTTKYSEGVFWRRLGLGFCLNQNVYKKSLGTKYLLIGKVALRHSKKDCWNTWQMPLLTHFVHKQYEVYMIVDGSSQL